MAWQLLLPFIQQPLSGGVRGDLSASLTLHRLIVWTQDPLQRMKLLAVLVDKSKGGAGGHVTGWGWWSCDWVGVGGHVTGWDGGHVTGRGSGHVTGWGWWS